MWWLAIECGGLRDPYSVVRLSPQPLTLRNVFISNQGTRVTLGRIPWGERVEADDTACSSKLAARSQLLAASFAGMLTSMLAPAEASAGRASSGAGAGAGAGANGGDGGDEATGSAASPVRTFNRIQCLRGLHVKCGESFVVRCQPGASQECPVLRVCADAGVWCYSSAPPARHRQLELPTRAGGGYVWDPPTVVAQVRPDRRELVQPVRRCRPLTLCTRWIRDAAVPAGE